ncbi:MAG: lipopolysaccharide biosynthesis protein [Sphingobacteriaceae bacterium]|jgi:hypothetical protein|nr:lipopolysaccharide biosynthesis protein [Sphingobacteriaceae bacterium]
MQEVCPKPQTVDDEVSIRELIFKIKDWYRYLLSKWVTFLLVTIVGGLLGLVYSSLTKPIYIAEVSFALEDEKSTGGIGGYAAIAGQFGIDLGGSGGGAFSGDNLIELMKSRTMVEKTLLMPVNVRGRNQTLAELYIDFNNLRDQWKDEPRLLNIHFNKIEDQSRYSLQRDSLISEFHKDLVKNNLSVEKIDKKLSIITVRVESKSELFSKLFSEGIVKNVSDFYIETKTKKSAQNVAILQHQTDSVRRQLNAAISGVATSIDANPNANPSRQILRVPSQRRQVDAQANQAILSELVKNLEISKVTLRKETPLVQIIDEPVLPLERNKLSKLKGLLIGAIAGAFFCFLYLISSKLYRSIMMQ